MKFFYFDDFYRKMHNYTLSGAVNNSFPTLNFNDFLVISDNVTNSVMSNNVSYDMIVLIQHSTRRLLESLNDKAAELMNPAQINITPDQDRFNYLAGKGVRSRKVLRECETEEEKEKLRLYEKIRKPGIKSANSIQTTLYQTTPMQYTPPIIYHNIPIQYNQSASVQATPVPQQIQHPPQTVPIPQQIQHPSQTVPVPQQIQYPPILSQTASVQYVQTPTQYNLTISQNIQTQYTSTVQTTSMQYIPPSISQDSPVQCNSPISSQNSPVQCNSITYSYMGLDRSDLVLHEILSNKGPNVTKEYSSKRENPKRILTDAEVIQINYMADIKHPMNLQKLVIDKLKALHKKLTADSDFALHLSDKRRLDILNSFIHLY